MIATPNSIKLFGAKPIFLDVEPKPLCLNIKQVKEVITRKTKSIMLISANRRYPRARIKVRLPSASQLSNYNIKYIC